MGFDLLGVMRDYKRAILRAALATTGLVVLVGGLYLWWWQPTESTWTLEFRPTFEGASEGRYPNGLRFGASDLTAPSIVDTVYDQNGISKYCGREEFRNGYFVEQRSLEFALLDLEFQGRLAEVRLTAVERERLQAEYRARRQALPLTYRLVYVRPQACSAMPALVVAKSLTDVLTVWAEESEAKRGVLNVQVSVLSPAALDVGLNDEGSLLIRADLIRTALRRIEQNASDIEAMPGAGLLRMGESRTTFAEVRARLRDLVQARLEPMVIAAGRGLGRDSIAWVEEALASAGREQQVAEGKARAFLDALREYSGTPQTSTPTTAPDQPPTGSSDVQTLAPQIDRTFIDRIIDMSEANTTFRQEMTRQMVLANIQAVEHSANVAHYQHMSESLRRPGTGGLTPQDVEVRLTEIVTEGKRLAQQLNELYDEFSRVSLRVSPLMYEVDRPVAQQTVRRFTFRLYVFMVFATFVLTLLAAFIVALIDRRVKAVPVTS